MGERRRRTGTSNRDGAYPDPLAAAQHSGLAHWALEVDDLDATYGRLIRGGARGWPPADAVRPGDRFACIHDPEGNLLELIEQRGLQLQALDGCSAEPWLS